MPIYCKHCQTGARINSKWGSIVWTQYIFKKKTHIPYDRKKKKVYWATKCEDCLDEILSGKVI